MKRVALAGIHVLTAVILLGVACSDPERGGIKGNWLSEDGNTRLKVTDKTFAIDKNAEIAEDYFIKGDTVYTSFEGNQPYSKFAIQQLNGDDLMLLDPDSVSIHFKRVKK